MLQVSDGNNFFGLICGGVVTSHSPASQSKAVREPTCDMISMRGGHP